MRPELTKSQRRRIRELAGLAYQRELSSELTALEDQFKRWRSGEITCHEVDAKIHEFHQGAHRELFTLYTGGQVEMAVAGAIARDVVSEVEAGAEVIEILGTEIGFSRMCADPDAGEGSPGKA